MKCIIPPKISAVIKSSKITQLSKKAEREGTVIIIDIILPFKTISLMLSLDFVASDNKIIFKNGNKNQRYFIFGKQQFVLFVKLQKNSFK